MSHLSECCGTPKISCPCRGVKLCSDCGVVIEEEGE